MKNYFFIIMLLLGGGFAYAQTITVSKETEIPLLTGTNTIVRDCDNDYIVTYIKNGDTNKFDICSRTFSTNKHFNFNNEFNTIGRIKYTVNDMFIHKKWCYFCGTKYIPTSVLHSLYGPDLITYDTMGFVGRFNVDSVWTGSCHYYLRQIDQAKTLDKLTVYEARDLIIDAIGQYKSNTDSACIVELFYSQQLGNWRWNYEVYTLDDPQEILTDIITTDKMLITASRWHYDRYYLLLRQCTLGGIRNATMPEARYVYFSSWIDRFPYHPYLLCPTGGQTFVVAYEADNLGPNPGVVLCKMSSPGSMDKMQYLMPPPSNQLLDIAYVHQKDGTVLLCKDSEHPNGVLRFPKWSVPSYPYADTALSSNAIQLQSIDADNNFYILAAGKDNQSQRLHHYVQHRDYVSDVEDLCMNEDVCDECYDFLSPINSMFHRRVFVNKYSSSFSWSKYQCNINGMIDHTTCLHTTE